MGVQKYKISFRVKKISQVSAAKEEKFHIYKWPWNIVLIILTLMKYQIILISQFIYTM